MTAWWLAVRYLGSFRRFFSLPTSLSAFGMTVGVASLVVSMAVFSGYARTLEKTVQDAVGHVIILKRGVISPRAMNEELRPILRGAVAKTEFLYAEAILAGHGKISGILLEGVDEASVHQVLNLEARVIAGTAHLGRTDNPDVPPTLIGKGIADRFGLNVGDEYRMVVPLAGEIQSQNFRPKLGRFKVAGIINYGRYDFDSRYVMMSLKGLQDFIEVGDRITGLRLRLNDPSNSREMVSKVSVEFGNAYWARDWYDMNRNLFEAARLEKRVLFLVLMILVVAAAFNVANTLFISVVQRYRDISVFKTLGASDRLIRRVFAAQGLIVGGVGAGLGVIIGLLLCRVFEWAETRWRLIPAEVYKLDHIELVVSFSDIAAIMGAALFICLIATLVPSRRGARISPVEGLRYE